ncbi:DUF262 domain-containing protein [Metabacillus sp. B2-18]|uniref:DUF262 domain-containing protein n=1 Tax=Metabacillus sp. B2-18 TaxID=2897333 RepID=UPI001E3C2C2B|nr:DUF262 domain-containing protein [Metabacillus sp. B2-18]UGB33202.1 DUF262 domain-containing HNH endonuclease family protein [Metabacillus sp. B2-18]
MEIQSNLVTLKSLVEKQFLFNIPIYQRLYVWQEGQVKTLLEDIEAAFNDEKELFYLGGVLVVENSCVSTQQRKVYDLIDGQQRFTTLWMISIVFAGALKSFIENEEENRINFAIREVINEKFQLLINGTKNVDITANIDDALALIRRFHSEFEGVKPGNAAKIAKFIYEKVQLVFTEVPEQTDLNKLFEVINNRGIQLQHHEILKARFLDKLQAKDRMKYSNLWDACANMNQYIEKNIKDLTHIKTTPLFDQEAAKVGEEQLADATKVLAAIDENEEENNESMTLLDILESEDVRASFNDEEKHDEDEYDSEDVRSIMTFPMLLQHTLRIYLAKKKQNDIPKISDKEILIIFSENFLTKSVKDEDIKEFIELLWKVRYYFDKHVIKWVGPKDHEIHSIRRTYKNANKNGRNIYYSLQRGEPTARGEALLQSVLYHSQQITTHYWLTPYLHYLIENNGKDSYTYLKHLDNHLLCAVKDDETLIERTRHFLEKHDYKTTLSTKILHEELGTEFPHYWFYKLEYVLWEKYANKGNKWREFKVTAKNSVEHISPQNQKMTDTNTVSQEQLNKFGNLALVSRSVNSEYSNLPFNEKRQRFINNNREKLDSLKMALIYENESWNDELAKEHQVEMIRVLEEYLGIL